MRISGWIFSASFSTSLTPQQTTFNAFLEAFRGDKVADSDSLVRRQIFQLQFPTISSEPTNFLSSLSCSGNAVLFTLMLYIGDHVASVCVCELLWHDTRWWRPRYTWYRASCVDDDRQLENNNHLTIHPLSKLSFFSVLFYRLFFLPVFHMYFSVPSIVLVFTEEWYKFCQWQPSVSWWTLFIYDPFCVAN